MKKNTTTPRLALSRTTVHVLTDRALAGAAGGAIRTTTEKTDDCPHSVLCTSHLFLCP